MPQDQNLRQQLIASLFKQDDDELLFASRFIDSQPGTRVDKDEFSDDSKMRLICLTSTCRLIVVKKQKIRISKVKAGNFSSFSVAKTWSLDEVRAIEKGDIDSQLNVTMGTKISSWTFEDLPKKVEFIYSIVKATQNDEKRMPRFVGFDGEMVMDQMAAINAQFAVQEQAIGAATSAENLADSNDEFQDDEEHADVELPPVDLDLILSDFNWTASADASALEASLIAELQALEAANVHDIIQSEVQANAVVVHIEKSLEELDQINSWLSHYTGLLEKMGNDVHQIEAQNKGMQVTTNNQKTLLQELELFIQSVRVPSFILEILANEALDTADGVRECEVAIEKVMNVVRYKNEDLSEMASVKERVQFLQGHANTFSTRLCDYLSVFFSNQAEMYLNDKTRASQRNALKLFGHENTESKLYKFKKLLTWLKDIDTRKHYDLQVSYVNEVSRTYKREIGDFLEILKSQHMSKKPDETDFLPVSTVTSVVKTAIGVSDKTTGGIRLELFKKKKKEAKDEDDDDDNSMTGSDAEERMNPDEGLGHALLKLTNIMVREQNFIMDFFGIVKHVAPVVVSATQSEPPELAGEETYESWQALISTPRQAFKDPKGEKRINELMELTFEDVRDILQAAIDVGLKYDQSYSVGMMAQIEYHSKEYQKTCHIYVINLLETLLRKVNLTFDKFVADQIKAIEDTRIRIKKRTGILQFRFVDRVEKMLSAWDGASRKLIDKAYARIVKSMFETLEAEAQQDIVDAKTADEKDSLNKHIMIVENMHHFHSEIRARKVPSLEGSVKQAKIVYDANLESYCKAVIRKPLGKLLEFFEGVEGLLKTGPADEVSYHVQYSKSALKDVIKKYPGKEIKKSLEVLYKRVDKHFTEEEGLLQVIWRSIQEEFCRQLRKYEELITKCYPDITMRLDFTLEELLGYFSEMAQGH